jgi:hypothetical protein
MPQEQVAQQNTMDRPFGQKSDTTLWISLAVGFAVMGALGAAHWSSSASAHAAAKPVANVQGKPKSDPVYRCADGRVSFTPCN